MSKLPLHKKFTNSLGINKNMNIFSARITLLFSVFSLQWLVWACFLLQIFSNRGCSCETATLISFSMPSFDLYFLLIEATAEKLTQAGCGKRKECGQSFLPQQWVVFFHSNPKMQHVTEVYKFHEEAVVVQPVGKFITISVKEDSDLIPPSNTLDKTFPLDSHRDSLWDKTAIYADCISSYSKEKDQDLTGPVLMLFTVTMMYVITSFSSGLSCLDMSASQCIIECVHCTLRETHLFSAWSPPCFPAIAWAASAQIPAQSSHFRSASVK